MKEKRITLRSSMLSLIVYDDEKQTLDVVFQNGRRYRYFEVPEIVFAGFERAESKGRFFNERIRDSFPSTRR